MRAALIAAALALVAVLLSKAPKPPNECPDCKPAIVSCAQG